MTVLVIYTTESKKILLQIEEQLNEKDIIPEAGKKYHVFFEEIKEEPEPEFNQG